MRTLKPVPAFLALALLGCGAMEIGISISPREASVNANAQYQFTASVSNAGNKDVAWSTTDGSVTASGLFTAPELATTAYVTATSLADPSKTATARVTIVAPVVVSPGVLSLGPGAIQVFTATVVATGDTAMTWSIQEGAAGGTITADGTYTAPAVAGTYHIVATSVADPTQIGIAVVTVTSTT